VCAFGGTLLTYIFCDIKVVLVKKRNMRCFILAYTLEKTSICLEQI